MRTKTARLSTVAAAVILLVAGLLIKGTSTAWSLEQTIAAMKKIETLHISGKDLCHGDQVSFECWVRLPSKGSDGLKMRYQCGCKRKTTIVVQGGTVYRYYPLENVVTALDGSRIEDLQFWYEGAKLSPWLTGTLIQTLRLFVDDWSQTVETDPDTGRQQILVTCSYPPSNTSFLFVVDPESRLIQRAKLWKNLQRQGEPYLDAQVLTYNPEIPDEFFEFKVPAGATVIDQKEEDESRALFDQGEQLFHNEKKYAEAIEVYRRVYDTYPKLNVAEEALMMIGLCHTWLGQRDKAIEAYQKAINEYPHLTGWIDATYLYLGIAYLEEGQKEKALEAFENCLAAGEGVRDPEKFPLKDAREFIARIKGR